MVNLIEINLFSLKIKGEKKQKTVDTVVTA